MGLTDSAGGYAVPFTLDPSIQVTGGGSQSDIATVARQVVTTSDSWAGVTAGQISASYDVEAAEVSDDSPTLAQPTVDIHMARVFVPASIEIIMDQPNWSQEISGMMLDALQRLEAEKFTIGSGTGEPEGIVTGLTGGTNEVDSAATDTFALADLYSLWEAAPPRHRDASAWLGNELIYSDIRQFGTANNYSGFSVDLTEDASSRLLGRPAYRSSHMDGTITGSSENYVLIAADMKSCFVIARRIGFTIEMIPHLFATANNLPSGQRGLFGYARNGSAVVDETAGALLNVT
jgi:HK97 family phage major capsid protein